MSYELKSVYASLPRTTRGVPIVIGGDPKGKNFLYTNGNSVYMRNLANPEICEVYTEHSTLAICAKYAPTGFYIASGDQHGKVRIWDTIQKEHILKAEYQPLGGPIKDLSWSGDSQRIVVGGDGRERFGHVFNMDTGTSVGEIMGQSKGINSVDFRAQRPFRIATASEDNTVAFFHGPPFKFQFTLGEHSRFVNCVRYAPNSDVFVSGGAEGKAFVYDGKEGTLLRELGAPAHKGGIYGVCFSSDSKKVLTVSGDKTAKTWDVASGSMEQQWTLGTTVEDMQVGCLWQGDIIISVSLSGAINYLDQANTSQPSRIVKGHNKPITAMALSVDKQTVFSASSDGNVCYWDVNTGANDQMKGKGHSNQVQDMAVSDDTLFTCAMDDTVMLSSVSTKTYGQQVKLSSQPKRLAVGGAGLCVVACIKDVVVLMNANIMFTLKADYEPQCVSIHPGQNEVAVGSEAEKVYIYTLSGSTLVEKQVLESSTACVTGLAYSPDGSYLAASDSNRKVVLYQLPEYKPIVTTQWSSHTARINSVDWTPDSRHLVTGGLDTSLFIWTPESKMKIIHVKSAHPMSQITRALWLDDNNIISAGQDSCLRKWSITHF